MTTITDTNIFSAVMTAGSIISGFCGTFLSFRIQREANDFRTGKDGVISKQQFSISLILIILATIISLLVGVIFPLIALVKSNITWLTTRLVVSGLISGIILLVGYLFNELFHYRMLFQKYWPEIEMKDEWKRESPILVIFVVLSVLFFYFFK